MTWKDASFAADKLFLLLFTAANIIIAAIFLGVLAGEHCRALNGLPKTYLYRL